MANLQQEIDESLIGPSSLKRQLRDSDIACPAGRVVGDAGCYCALEEGVVDGRTQTASIGAFCMSVEGHKTCPTWVSEKRRIEEGKRKSLLEPIKVNKRTKAQREERLAEAQARLYSNSPEGRRFRKRLGLRETL